jgi:formate hydrogenlyase transcriptional activator
VEKRTMSEPSQEPTVASLTAALRAAEAANQELAAACVLMAVACRLPPAQLADENAYLRDEARAGRGLGQLLGHSRAMQEVRRAIGQVAATDSTVLVLGETGTGKELVARAVHMLSRRRERLLVKVNCAALAPGVLASELFGHEAGAFTGAGKRRVGRFELADGGSIFLDEIAEVSLETQVHLLRVLQERVLERVGGIESVAVDVRVIAATNRDLGAALADGSFRADLFYRLNVFPIRLPPLRERVEDLPLLIRHFLNRHGPRMGKQVGTVAARTLEMAARYPWPGNVRELENLVERALIVNTGSELEIDPGWLAGSTNAIVEPAPSWTLAGQERQAILEALKKTGNRIYGANGAAALLGLKPTTLYGRMRKHGIRKPSTTE